MQSIRSSSTRTNTLPPEKIGKSVTRLLSSVLILFIRLPELVVGTLPNFLVFMLMRSPGTVENANGFISAA